MWITDGTAAGTRRLFDLVPGAGSGLLGNQVSDGWATLLGTTWFFLGTTAATGTEPFVFDAGTLQTPCTTCPAPGCPGTNGVPRLTAVGPPRLGNVSFACRVDDARATTVAIFLFDGPGTPTALPGGCTLFTSLAAVTQWRPTDGLGQATLGLPIPNAQWLLGVALRMQWAVLDPNGAYAQMLSFSNGCHLVIGN